ncbi:hypothetical protein LCGC14_2368960 [marine sediment metagenome]|uniref:Uncharacterized protein n=1 Tax=marine sediment metagenome TaxID=412755 RepID=A0A0F9C488_9ZZZZ
MDISGTRNGGHLLYDFYCLHWHHDLTRLQNFRGLGKKSTNENKMNDKLIDAYVAFRQGLRSELARDDFWPNNPRDGDNEILYAVNRLMNQRAALAETVESTGICPKCKRICDCPDTAAEPENDQMVRARKQADGLDQWAEVLEVHEPESAAAGILMLHAAAKTLRELAEDVRPEVTAIREGLYRHLINTGRFTGGDRDIVMNYFDRAALAAAQKEG